MTWDDILTVERTAPYYEELMKFIDQEYATTECYPPREEIFRAMELCSYEEVKVVILGQDPYHGEGQANGLCFSVRDGQKFPPSLLNIFKEIRNDLGCEIPFSGNLTHWARQGVLMINATMTVRSGKAGSHQNKGWEIFTDAVIRELSERKENIVFILWGAYAQKKRAMIDEDKHMVLISAHPSPLSAHNGFWGNKHFSKTNEYLEKHSIEPIKWSEY